MHRVILVGVGLLSLIASEALAGSATLTWTPNSEADLAGYHVYRGNGVCAPGPLQPLLDPAGTPVTLGKVATYTDASVPSFDGSLCYELTAFDTGGNESVHSTRASKTVNLVPPVAPAGLVITTVTP